MAAPTKATFGLLGRTLGHSWSPKIHAGLGSSPYELIELEPDEVVPFIREGSWRGLNVTIPYKRVAAEAADVQSPRVKRLGVANTLVRTDEGIHISVGDKDFLLLPEKTTLTELAKHVRLSGRVSQWKPPKEFKDWNDVIMRKPFRQVETTNKFRRDEALEQRRNKGKKL